MESKSSRGAGGMVVGGWGGVKNSHDCSASLGVTEQHSQSTVSIMNILSLLQEH